MDRKLLSNFSSAAARYRVVEFTVTRVPSRTGVLEP